MFRQTIALFRYQLLGLVNARVLLLLLVIMMAGFVVSEFIAELAIINSELIKLALVGDFLRYSLVLLLIVTICHQISQDYELSQFDRLLSMPLNRGQYVSAQILVVLTVALVFSLSILIYFIFATSLEVAFYWFISVYLELVLTGLIAMFAILSIEKLPLAIIFSFALYLLSKLTPLIDLALAKSSFAFSEEVSFQFSSWFFSMIQYLLPGRSAFAQNNIFFDHELFWGAILDQFFVVSIYAGLLVFVSLIDFYRKEFNR